MRRMGLLIACLLATGLAFAQEAQDAVGIMVMLQAGTVTTLDVSFPADVNMSDINSDLQRVTQWTGWALASPEVSEPKAAAPAPGAPGQETTAHITLIEPAAVQSVLNDVVWPLVAAFAERKEIGVAVQGTELNTPALQIENRYVRLEQSGGQGVQLYRVTVKDTSFSNLDDLRRNELPGQVAEPRQQGSRSFLLWLLAVVASLATGAVVYTIVARRQRAK